MSAILVNLDRARRPAAVPGPAPAGPGPGDGPGDRGRLEVSVRTVYRDLNALVAAGVPVLAESGPGGGCRLLDGYRFPLRGLRPDEAEALLILGVPGVLRELGLDAALDAAQRQIRVTLAARICTWLHLDMPRWFGSPEDVPCLGAWARAVRSGRRLALGTARRAWPGPAMARPGWWRRSAW